MILDKIQNLQDLDPQILRGRDYIDKITLHWTGGTYTDVDHSAYHIVISGTGQIYVTRNFDEVGAHTWQRNTGNLGVSLACCAGLGDVWADGTVTDWGDYPPTDEQVEAMARVVAYLAVGLGVEMSAVQDHHHYAVLDGYGSDRVDIMSLPQESGDGRNIIVGKARWYLEQWGY